MTILSGSIERLKDLINDTDSYTNPSREQLEGGEVDASGMEVDEETPSTGPSTSSSISTVVTGCGLSGSSTATLVVTPMEVVSLS